MDTNAHQQTRLSDLAAAMRSKKMGPFGLHLQVTFKDRACYARAQRSGALDNATLRALYGVHDDEILTNMFCEEPLEWRATLLRPRLSGEDRVERDSGEDHYIPLMTVVVPAVLIEVVSQDVAATTIPRSELSSIGLELEPPYPDRSTFTTLDSLSHLWSGLGMPLQALDRVSFSGEGLGLPSSFKIGHVAQASIGLSGLAASLIHSFRSNSVIPRVRVDLRHACAEFRSEALYRILREPAPKLWGPIGGLHETSDGHVRIHDGFAHHRYGTLRLLGLSGTATRQEVTGRTRTWQAVDLETVAVDEGLVVAALRSYSQWDLLPQAKAITNFPVEVRQIAPGPQWLSPAMSFAADKCLRGLRVVELSRVIAAPVAGRTLAAHGADVIWVTSPNLPDLPATDPDTMRGKRRVQLDLDLPSDRGRLLGLISYADVVIQSYRPGSLALRGFGPEDLALINPNLIYASLSAYGPAGPWAGRRGFDSLVQTCSGMNTSEAEHFNGGGGVGGGPPARPLPCQALDHSAGYLLASGIMAALYRRATQGGSYLVEVSLAGCMKYIRSLGQFDGRSGFECEDPLDPEALEDLLQTKPSMNGPLRAVRHSVQVEGVETGWDYMLTHVDGPDVAWF